MKERRNAKGVRSSGRMKRLLPALFKLLFWLALILIPLGVGFAWVVVTRLSADLPPADMLEKAENAQTTRIMSRDGKVLATLFVENRTVVPLDRISPYLVKALLAVEDSRFFQHHGVDWIGVGRAALANVFFRGIDQGASTLTMQLARNRFLTQDQTFARKIREIVMAQRLEKKYSKEKLLEYYLNTVYFGSGAYGVHAASSLYFGKSPHDLSVAEAALIAGLVQAPSTLSPLVNPEGAKKRMKIVLGRMRDTKILTEAQYEDAVKEGEGFRFQTGSAGSGANSDQLLKYPYFTTYVIAQLAERYPEDLLYRGGLRVRTTLDIELQKLCEEELRATMAELGPAQNANNAALVLIENSTGSVRAMVGGTRWSQNNQFNRAWQAVRQPGSSFKAFVYASALLQGMTPDSLVDDSPVTYGDWSPKNSDGKFKGRITLAQALQESRNVIAARLCEAVGPARVVEVAHALGVTEPLQEHLALALGACEVSPLSMASAYSTIAAGGVYHAPVAVTQILDKTGEVVTDNRSSAGKQILPKDVSDQLIGMLMRVVQYGTGQSAYIDGVDVAGKTGTTDDSRDAWFVGFTPEYTLAVWVGNDDHSAMWDVYGGGIPATLWRRVMLGVVQHGMQQARFSLEHTSAHSVTVCAESGQLATAGCPKVQYLRVDAEHPAPTEKCELHGSPTPEPEVEEEDPEAQVTETPWIDATETPQPQESTLPLEATPLVTPVPPPAEEPPLPEPAPLEVHPTDVPPPLQ